MDKAASALHFIDVAFGLAGSVLTAIYMRLRMPAISQEAEEKRAGQLRNMVADYDRMLSGVRDDYERLRTDTERLRTQAARQSEELAQVLRDCYLRGQRIKELEAELRAHRIPLPPTVFGEEA